MAMTTVNRHWYNWKCGHLDGPSRDDCPTGLTAVPGRRLLLPEIVIEYENMKVEYSSLGHDTAKLGSSIW